MVVICAELHRTELNTRLALSGSPCAFSEAVFFGDENLWGSRGFSDNYIQVGWGWPLAEKRYAVVPSS